MKLSQHGENLFQLTLWGAFNCYLVREADGLTLIDALMAGRGNDILAAATELGQPIRRVLLTHAHTDHVGALDEIAAALPEAEFLFTARTEQFLRGDVRLEPGEPEAPIKGGFSRRETA
ncbi:MAG: MBL fold metallo-hydrolase, partial [Anaerolineales bacterium]|nr:MBL fold metallo-hydrolase [Anaerolineales bacterium]